MKKSFQLLIIFVIFSVILSACTQPATPTVEETQPPEETEAVEEPEAPEPTEEKPEVEPTEQVAENNEILYVNLTWHQHQPLYYKDANGVYTRPWVRAHATKDYLDMAEKVADYPDVHVTFNYTPSLIRQLNDLASGAKDIYWVLGEKPVNELTEADKQFILERFYDVNWTNIIAKFPRFQELLEKRGGTSAEEIQAAVESFTDQDFLDLQIWFNLAWFDPVYLSEEPLASLVEKGQNFTEEDKIVLFEEVLNKVQAVIPYHKDLQDAGQIEVTTTPYAHPILPLIYDNQLALVGNPSAEMPKNAFSYPQDAEAHLSISVDMYEENFGQSVRGLWPGEGSVAQDIVPLVADAGYAFMQTGEPVLAKSLGIDSFTRDSQGFVQQADDLYRPYFVSDEDGRDVAIFFRDGVLSDDIGFVYSGMNGEAAADDMVNNLVMIRDYFVENNISGPHIVSIILDGENAWEHYPNDGNDFLNALYQKLSETEVLQTITPSEYIEMFPEQRTIDDLFPGAWFSPNYDTWIGETEEAIAWDYLADVRADLAATETAASSMDAEALQTAYDFMYLAEGSDWFWWYGDDQDSGQDSYFDEGYRALLAGVYESLGQDVPTFVQVPIIQKRAIAATRPFSEISTPVIDGQDDPAWETAALYTIPDDPVISDVYYTIDEENIYLRVDSEGALSTNEVDFYFSVPNKALETSALAFETETLLGFNVNTLIKWSGGTTVDVYQVVDEEWSLIAEEAGGAAKGTSSLEVSFPIALLGELSAGTTLKMTLVSQPNGVPLPAEGPMGVVIPDLGQTTAILTIEDPVGDDYGPGTYTYPDDAVFKESAFDANNFEVGYDSENLVFTFTFVGPVENPWGSPRDLSIQTLDVYIDTDPGSSTGARMLLPGRNAALMEGFGWEYAVWAEGWTPQVVTPDAETLEPKDYSEASSAMIINVDIAKNAVIVRVPLSFLGDGNPEDWAYAAMVLGQEGYPTEGVWRVRNVAPSKAQWVFGGGTGEANATRIIDLILPVSEEWDQASLLADFEGAFGSLDSLTPDDFAQIPMLTP
jgi:alpha-amylase/alpha-mannosidase (GH57 family)